MTEFIWPSDADRADNDELDRVCEYLDLLMNDHEDLQKVVETHRLNSDINAAKLKDSIEREAALAACLEQIADAWMYEDTGIHDNHAHGVMLPTARYRGVNQAIMDSRLMGVSLKRRDKVKQAEALNSFADWLPSDYECTEFQGGVNQARRHAKDHAARILRQAEALNDRPT